MRKLYEKVKLKRDTDYSTLNKEYTYTDKEGLEHIGYHTHGNNIQMDLDASFIKQTKKAKQHVLSDYFVQLRNENLRNVIGKT